MVVHSFCDTILTYLELGPPVPLGASGDGKSPSLTVNGDRTRDTITTFLYGQIV